MSVMSVKSVPGCFVTMAPSLIGSPVAFWPLPRPHFEAGAAASSDDDDPPPALLLLLPLSESSPHAAKNAAIATRATLSSAASDRGPFHGVYLRTDPPLEMSRREAQGPRPV